LDGSHHTLQKHELKRNQVYYLMPHPPNPTTIQSYNPTIFAAYSLTIFSLPNRPILQYNSDKGNTNINSLALGSSTVSLFILFYEGGFLGGFCFKHWLVLLEHGIAMRSPCGLVPVTTARWLWWSRRIGSDDVEVTVEEEDCHRSIPISLLRVDRGGGVRRG
jgi:hypothetical protein